MNSHLLVINVNNYSTKARADKISIHMLLSQILIKVEINYTRIKQTIKSNYLLTK